MVGDESAQGLGPVDNDAEMFFAQVVPDALKVRTRRRLDAMVVMIREREGTDNPLTREKVAATWYSSSKRLEDWAPVMLSYALAEVLVELAGRPVEVPDG